MNGMAKLMDMFNGDIAHVRIELGPGKFVAALLVSLIAAGVAALLYRFFFERRGTGSQVHRAFPLLAVAITTLFIGVQISIPLSLGLLGSLSIIRFRTPIKEPEEVGFIMLVIAASICSATFNFAFIVYMYAAALLGLVAMRGGAMLKCMRRDGMIVLVMDAAEASAKASAIEAVLSAKTRRHTLESSSVRNGQASFQYVFSGLGCDVPAFQSALSEAAAFSAVNVFLDRPGGIR